MFMSNDGMKKRTGRQMRNEQCREQRQQKKDAVTRMLESVEKLVFLADFYWPSADGYQQKMLVTSTELMKFGDNKLKSHSQEIRRETAQNYGALLTLLQLQRRYSSGLSRGVKNIISPSVHITKKLKSRNESVQKNGFKKEKIGPKAALKRIGKVRQISAESRRFRRKKRNVSGMNGCSREIKENREGDKNKSLTMKREGVQDTGATKDSHSDFSRLNNNDSEETENLLFCL